MLRFVLLGHPVAHSISPAIHAAAYRALGLPHRYELRDCADEAALEAAVGELRRGEIAGANVTIPWKRLAGKLADRAAGAALHVGAANVLARDANAGIVAYNTDVLALVEEWKRLVPELRRALVIGNGGAALAVVAALQALAAEEVVLTARSFVEPEPEAGWPSASEFKRLGATLLAWPSSAVSAKLRFEAAVRHADLIVQCTSAGMHGADAGLALAALVPWALAPKAALAYDLVYNPARTPFMSAARAAGIRAENGLGMLVGQAAEAIRVWLGVLPPQAPLLEAAEQALAAKRSG